MLRLLIFIMVLVSSALCTSIEQIPKYGSPLVLEVENTLISAARNETIAVTEFYAKEKEMTRVEIKLPDGTMEVHQEDAESKNVFIWSPRDEIVSSGVNYAGTGGFSDVTDKCEIRNITDDARELQRLIFLNKFLYLDDEVRQQFVFQEYTTVRGARVAKFKLDEYVYSSQGFSAKMRVEFFVAVGPWKNPISTEPMLRKIVLDGEVTRIGNKPRSFPFALMASVLFIGDSITGTNLFSLPAQCAALINSNTDEPETQPGNATNVSSANPNPFPIPDIPNEFTAIVETNMIEAQRSFTMVQAFSEPRRMSSTEMIERLPDMIGRRIERKIVIVGAFELAYDSEVKVTPTNHELKVEDDLKALLWPQDHTCNKNVFNFELMTSVRDMFLIDQSPRYMGTTKVRNVPARIWQTEGSGYSVQWFFGMNDWNFFNNNKAPLLRMVVRGQGKSPMFVHHPFLVDGRRVPEDAVRACKKFFGEWDDQCSLGEQFYTHVHDFISFSPGVRDGDFEISKSCFNSTSSAINAIPNAANCETGVSSGGAVLLALVVAAISAFISGSVVYFRMKPAKD